MISDLLGFKFDMEILECEHSGVYVKYDGEKAVVGGCSIPAKARAYTLLAKGISEGKKCFEISQQATFDTLGVMMDMSRGGVMKVDSVKKYLKYMAAHGMNMLMLYTEDTYEVKKYPYLGYQRGRYTAQELKEIDNFAASLGIEVIPCIQTLGHMEQFLRYSVNGDIADNATVLLVGEEKTYEFIEECIKTMRSLFRTDRIHIGCDETRGLGTGKYLKKHGLKSQMDIFNEHVARVKEICDKYGYCPMMWSDMFFAYSDIEVKETFDNDVKIPQSVIDNLPQIDMVFWDYYHTNSFFYKDNIEKHNKFNRNILFGGGIWTWDGFVPNYRHTYDTMKPALSECISGNVREVIATVWSNDGCETSHMLSIPALPVFSEYCWLGAECTEKDIWSMSKFVTGMTRELAHAISDFFLRDDTDLRAAKFALWGDPLISLLCYGYDFENGVKILEEGLSVIEKYENTDYFKAVFRTSILKCRLQTELYTAYKEDNRALLLDYAENRIPQIIGELQSLYDLHYESWHRDYKTHGFERLMHRYAGALERLCYAIKVIKRYLGGEIPVIEEFEYERIHGVRTKWLTTDDIMYLRAH